jgi:hypothetical protein
VLPPDLFENPPDQQDPAPFEAAADSADDIHLMSLHTPQARDAVGGESQIQATTQAAVDNSNAAFIDSKMVARCVLVHSSVAA